MNSNDERQIIRLFEDGDRALMSVDVREMERIYGEDYVQCDESGKLSTRADLIRNLTSAEIRFMSMRSTGRQVRVFGDSAVVHGSEEDEIERDGATLSSNTFTWMLLCDATDDGRLLRHNLRSFND